MCSHFSAEKADIAVGDAWEEFEFSRVILRNAVAENYFSIVKDQFITKDSSFDDIYKTQWHLLQFKKRSAPIRRRVLSKREKDRIDKTDLPFYEKITSYFFIYEILFIRRIREFLLTFNPKMLLLLNSAIRKFDFFLGNKNKKYILEDVKRKEEQP